MYEQLSQLLTCTFGFYTFHIIIFKVKKCIITSNNKNTSFANIHYGNFFVNKNNLEMILKLMLLQGKHLQLDKACSFLTTQANYGMLSISSFMCFLKI